MTASPIADLRTILDVVAGFGLPQRPDSVSPLGNGLINDTFLVSACPAAESQQYVLQRINEHVFPAPLDVIENMQILLTHLRAALGNAGSSSGIVFPELIRAVDVKAYCLDVNGGVWRLLSYIRHSRTLEQVSDRRQVSQIGAALARFHLLTRSLDHHQLHDTLPGFHISSRYLAQYDQMRKPQDVVTGEKAQYCRQAIETGRSRVNVLERARAGGELHDAVMHGDPKINNFLFQEGQDRVLSLIDLDTVKPGLILYDLGDCVRSVCNPAGENRGGSGTYFDFDSCRVLLQAYLETMGTAMAAGERKYIYDGVRLMPYELGLRFYTDYLAGNMYFKVDYHEQNLDRALRQFRMLEAIEARQSDIEEFVAGLD